jgi:hypothetical protein
MLQNHQAALALTLLALGSAVAVACAISGSGGAPSAPDASTDVAATGDVVAPASDAAVDSPAADGGSDATDEGPLDAGPPCTLDDTFGSVTCDQCVTQHCCQPVNTCFASLDCLDLTQCAFDCADAGDAAACTQGCDNAHPGSVQAFNAWVLCVGNYCKTECGK